MYPVRPRRHSHETVREYVSCRTTCELPFRAHGSRKGILNETKELVSTTQGVFISAIDAGDAASGLWAWRGHGLTKGRPAMPHRGTTVAFSMCSANVQ